MGDTTLTNLAWEVLEWTGFGDELMRSEGISATQVNRKRQVHVLLEWQLHMLRE